MLILTIHSDWFEHTCLLCFEDIDEGGAGLVVIQTLVTFEGVLSRCSDKRCSNKQTILLRQRVSNGQSQFLITAANITRCSAQSLQGPPSPRL